MHSLAYISFYFCFCISELHNHNFVFQFLACPFAFNKVYRLHIHNKYKIYIDIFIDVYIDIDIYLDTYIYV